MTDALAELGLDAAARCLVFHPHLLLKCARFQARPNGGIKLRTTDRNGTPVFYRRDLDEFDDDLRKPWVDNPQDPRPEIPRYFKDVLRLESFLRCGLCESPYATDYAHIDPWEKCFHHHPRNLICLCSRCHVGYDREHRISESELRSAKSSLETRLTRLVLDMEPSQVVTARTFEELCRTIGHLLDENSVIFWSFGPASPLAQNSGDPEAAQPWREAIRRTILPNNATIASLLDSSRHVYEQFSTFAATAEAFVKHEVSYRLFVEEPSTSHQYFLFPQEFAEAIEQGRKSSGQPEP
jgi:hypothetical protein